MLLSNKKCSRRLIFQVLCVYGIISNDVVYLPGVNCEDLSSPLLTRQTNLNLDLQPAWSHKSIIHHVPPAERRNFVNIYHLSFIGFIDNNETHLFVIPMTRMLFN